MWEYDESLKLLGQKNQIIVPWLHFFFFKFRRNTIYRSLLCQILKSAQCENIYHCLQEACSVTLIFLPQG